MSAAPQQFSTLAQAQEAAQAQEDRLNGQAAFGNSQLAFGNSQATFANSQPRAVSQSTSQQDGFGDASDQEIAEIRAGTYQETTDNNPEYNFRYKVADETEQTYMAMEEQRAGDTVTGSYQYVDPLGSLIVVNYSAGPGGYQETREVKPNFVTIKARPVRTQVQQTVSSVNSAQRLETQRLQAQRQQAQRQEAQRREAARKAQAQAQANRLNAQTASRPSQSDIVSQIVAQIQPLVSQTVTSAVGISSGAPRFSSRPAAGGRTVARVRVPARIIPTPTAPVLVTSGPSGDLSSVFGQGGVNSVRFNTPNFNIEY